MPNQQMQAIGNGAPFPTPDLSRSGQKTEGDDW